MKKELCVTVCMVILISAFYLWGTDSVMSKHIRSIEDVKKLFPTTPEQIAQETDRYIQEANNTLDALLAVPAHQRTFKNTMQPFDELESISNIAIKYTSIETLAYVHPDDAMRNAAHDAAQKIKEFFIDMSLNKALYEAVRSYVEGNARNEDLSQEQRYFLDETMQDFKRAGLHLPQEKLDEIKKIQKELSQLSQDFAKNIAEDNRTITVSRDELVGLDDAFIASLSKTEQGDYVLGVDYPTYDQVMRHAEVEKTRKRLYEAFMNRAYPVNKAVMQKIIALRDQLAKKLGYKSYAHLDTENQMVQSPERAEAFLKDLAARAHAKEMQELELFKRELPPSVSLTKDGKMKAWDLAFVTSYYKKKHFNIDERVISEYFPMQKTIDELLDIYRTFLGVDFKEVALTGLWDSEVRAIEVFNQDHSQKLGYLLLDLYPRKNKYSHACHIGIVPGVMQEDGRIAAVSIVICNFPKAMSDKPALLMRSDVNTFFHEFGHALHALLGVTHVGSFSGTRVKRDFVELPSQMLEEWLSNKEILKKVSGHYQTKQPLSDGTIDTIISLKQFGTGYFVRRQCLLSHISLACFAEGEQKDVVTLEDTLYRSFQPHIEWGDRNMVSAFGHLTGYGSKYYGYMWSKVFALDLFDTINQHGLLNPQIGKKYVEEVIGRGGSCDPNELLKNFLGREPNADAFMKHMGFDLQ